jgi:hypothetical protein
VVEKEDHIEKAEQPETSSLSPGTIHDIAGGAFGIRNLALSKVLMLMMGFTLKVFDAIEVEDVKDMLPALGLGVVREETVGCTMVVDQIFESLGHVGFETHRVDNSLGASLANIELSHSSLSMTKDAIIMSRSVTEEGVSRHAVTPLVDIVGRETGLEVFSHR